jgi:hypothetical protein
MPGERNPVRVRVLRRNEDRLRRPNGWKCRMMCGNRHRNTPSRMTAAAASPM